MQAISTGWLTDLKVRELEGARIEQRADHVIVRSAATPDYRWGNFVLFTSARTSAETDQMIAEFQLAFPDADHIAIGVDFAAGDRVAAEDWRACELSCQVHSVLTAAALREPERRPPATEFRRIHSDEDWREAAELSAVNAEADGDYRDYLERRMRSIRGACEGAHGAWFGAFRDEQLHSALGIFDTGSGIARFQGVDTHPDHRRQGLASNLIFAASEWARAHFRTRTLVIVADPEDIAIGVYRTLGFTDSEHQLQLERVPTRRAAERP